MRKRIRKKKPPAWHEKLGISGLGSLLFLAGGVAYLATIWSFRLVLRDEFIFLKLPGLFIAGGFVLCALYLWIYKQIATAQGIKIGWRLLKTRTRGEPSTWDELIFVSLLSALGLSIGLGLFLNCFCDDGPDRTYDTTVLQKAMSESRRYNTYHLLLSDWKKPGGHIVLQVQAPVFNAFHEGQRITIKTKEGLLGYEWLIEIGNTGRAA